MTPLVSLVLLVGGQTSAKPLSVRYTNARFGYSVEIPSSLILKQEAANGDGRTYLSKDARTELLVYGSHQLLDEKGGVSDSLAGGYRRWVQQSTRKGTVAKFSKLGSDSFAVSWREGRRLLYVKTVRAADGFATVEITYPVDRRPAMDAAVARTMASLRAAKR